MPRKILSLILSLALLFSQTGLAQAVTELNISGYLGAMQRAPIDKFRLPHLRYFSYDNLNNQFRILVDKGDVKELGGSKLTESSRTLLSYFLIGVTLPDDCFWVNLRPDSPNDIIDGFLAQTDIGKILLEADLQLKRDTAQFTSPQSPQGKEYWDKLYKKAGELFGSQNITIPTLTRPWIVPGEVIVRESQDSAYVYKATLKVLLEQDYLKNSAVYNFSDPRLKVLNEYSSQLIRELIIPKLTKEVNSARRYAALRQVYYSLILARWFKNKFNGKSGLYASLIDRKNLDGLMSAKDWSKTAYFKEYQKSFKNGEYNLQVPVGGLGGQNIRTYFSGGIAFMKVGSSPIGGFNGRLPNFTEHLPGTFLTGQPGSALFIEEPNRKTETVTSSPLQNKKEALRRILGANLKVHQSKGDPPLTDLKEVMDLGFGLLSNEKVEPNDRWLGLLNKLAGNTDPVIRAMAMGILLTMGQEPEVHKRGLKRLTTPNLISFGTDTNSYSYALASIFLLLNGDGALKKRISKIASNVRRYGPFISGFAQNVLTASSSPINTLLRDMLTERFTRDTVSGGKTYLVSELLGLVNKELGSSLIDKETLITHLASISGFRFGLSKSNEGEMLRVERDIASRPLRVLIVEDSSDWIGKVKKAVEDFLKGKDFITEVARDGVEGWIKFQKQNYDLVITDWRLPLTDGVELMNKIREENSVTPIVFMSTKSRDDMKAATKNLSGIALLEKRYFSEQFEKTIASSIESASSPVQVQVTFEEFQPVSKLGPSVVDHLKAALGSSLQEIFKTKRFFIIGEEAEMELEWKAGSFGYQKLYAKIKVTPTGISGSIISVGSEEDEETKSTIIENFSVSVSQDVFSPAVITAAFESFDHKDTIPYSAVPEVKRDIVGTLLDDLAIMHEGDINPVSERRILAKVQGETMRLVYNRKTYEPDGHLLVIEGQLLAENKDENIASFVVEIRNASSPVNASSKERMREALRNIRARTVRLDTLALDLGMTVDEVRKNIEAINFDRNRLFPYEIEKHRDGGYYYVVVHDDSDLPAKEEVRRLQEAIKEVGLPANVDVLIQKARLTQQGLKDAVDSMSGRKIYVLRKGRLEAVDANSPATDKLVSNTVPVKQLAAISKFFEDLPDGWKANVLVEFKLDDSIPNFEYEGMKSGPVMSSTGFRKARDGTNFINYALLYKIGPKVEIDQLISDIEEQIFANRLYDEKDWKRDNSYNLRKAASSSPVRVKDIVIKPLTEEMQILLELPENNIKELVQREVENIIRGSGIAGGGFLKEVAGEKIYFSFYVKTTGKGEIEDISFQLKDDSIIPKTIGKVETVLEKVSSSPLNSAPEKTGGIDFRNIPMTMQPMGSFSGLNFSLPPAPPNLTSINVDAELRQIQLMVQGGMVPSGQRIKELISVCYYKKELNSRIGDLISSLSDICRLEEEYGGESDSELKESLVLIDSIAL